MNLDEMIRLIQAVSDSSLSKFDLEEGNLRLSMMTDRMPAPLLQTVVSREAATGFLAGTAGLVSKTEGVGNAVTFGQGAMSGAAGTFGQGAINGAAGAFSQGAMSGTAGTLEDGGAAGCYSLYTGDIPAAQAVSGSGISPKAGSGGQIVGDQTAGWQMPGGQTAAGGSQASGSQVNMAGGANVEIPSDKVVKSPLVGTFYNASSPESEPFAKVGDTVKKGQVLGIIEAMKLMNEIESEYDGVVEAVLVENEQVVEYGQPLFRIR